MTNVLEKEFYHFERNVGEGISIHYMDAYLKFFFPLILPPRPPSLKSWVRPWIQACVMVNKVVYHTIKGLMSEGAPHGTCMVAEERTKGFMWGTCMVAEERIEGFMRVPYMVFRPKLDHTV